MNALVVVDNPKRWPLRMAGTDVVAARDYLESPQFAGEPGTKVFNLCRSYRYQSAGYYVSLLAEARGHRPLPSVSVMQDLKMSSVVRLASDDLEDLIQESMKGIKSDEFVLSIYFGRNLSPKYERLSLAIFNAFSAPMLRASFERDGKWRLTGLKAIGVGEVPETHRPFITEQAERYLKRKPSRGKAKKPARFDLAILHDPEEALPPSDAETLEKMCEAGEDLEIDCELITKDAYGRIAEFDGLFIRETTSVNHHTYRFARRAAAVGLYVIDDPVSIVRCSNKVFLAEQLTRHKIAMPTTVTFGRDAAPTVLPRIGLPCVIKKPDSSFSIGVLKVESEAEFERVTNELFETTDLLVAQEFVPTDFDWRVGILGGKPLFVCKYYMAPSHWQILKHEDSGHKFGRVETIPVERAPKDVVRCAIKAANLIGSGLYGVDLKQVRGRAIVMEVNDNPNIDCEVEDRIVGDALYETIMRHFLKGMEARRQ